MLAYTSDSCTKGTAENHHPNEINLAHTKFIPSRGYTVYSYIYTRKARQYKGIHSPWKEFIFLYYPRTSLFSECWNNLFAIYMCGMRDQYFVSYESSLFLQEPSVNQHDVLIVWSQVPASWLLQDANQQSILAQTGGQASRPPAQFVSVAKDNYPISCWDTFPINTAAAYFSI